MKPFKNVYNEWVKIVAKPRSYLGIGAITVLVAVIVFALKADGMSGHTCTIVDCLDNG